MHSLTMSSGLLRNVDVLVVLQTLLVGALMFAAVKVVTFWLYVQRMKQIFNDAPGPEDYHWLFGHFIKMPVDGEGRIAYFIDNCNKYCEKGYMFLWSPFKTPIIVASSPKIIAKICKSSEPKAMNISGAYRLARPWLGDGLLIASGNKWTRNRHLLTPAFHFDILKPYISIYNETADKLVAKWSRHAEKGEKFEVFQNICLLALEVILRCAFSYNKDVQGESNPYVQSVNRLVETVLIRFTKPWLLVDSIYWFTSYGRQFRRDCRYVHSIAEEVIEQRRKTLETEGSDPTKKCLDFLDILLQARDEKGVGLTPLEIRNEVDTFLFEGHDTTGSALSWLLYSLAQHPECQKRCQLEVDEILDSKDTEDIELSDFPKLVYLTMCIKEGLRLHSPVPIVSRETTKDFNLGDRVVPPGCIIQINIMVLNHMENIWGKNHMDFVPERFSPDNVSKMDPFQYVPFSAGPRNCIGQNFALNEEKVVVAKLLRNFTFTLDPNHQTRKLLTVVIRAENGIYMYAEKRKISK